MRALQRFFRSHLKTLLVVAGFILGAPALHAQTLLLGNMEQATSTLSGSFTLDSTTWDAQAFTTGTTTVRLTSVRLELVDNPSQMTVFLYSDLPGLGPGSQLAAFGSAGLVSGTTSTYRFKPTSTFTLSSGTTYWILMKSSGGSSYAVTDSLTLDAASVGSLPAQFLAESTNSGTSWILYSDTPAKFAVYYVDSNLVTLSSFTAQGGAGRVKVAWATGSEVDTAGFRVWRCASEDGTYTLATPSLLPATGVSPAGASYAWTDTGLTAGQTWYYKLEDVDTAGESTLHGPVAATVGASSILAFQASPTTLFQGGAALLSWSVSGVPVLTLNGGAVTGASLQVAPTATTSYTLADGAGSSSTVTVEVKSFSLEDLAGLCKAWGSALGEAAYDPSYDLNGDGKVDDLDVVICLKS